ncbi:hypothetical protein ASG49_17775 [Marmoricola sp. Leaf446]|uniref:sensor histidine kinase n=1 Tax=Marmoricola sp. Leaf446 TaxID=1736379 RepID=UPI0006F30ADE|nr:PAS domain-containing sensor histidine kinase [Marmoricola sp. Leaf446]KQT89575.1 hypothetical protein ASG49_17775 [Marmoricola sp. Leaf446]
MDESLDGAHLWRLTLEHSPIGMNLVALDGRLLMVNRAFCDMLGYDATTLTRRGFQDVSHPDGAEADRLVFARASSGEIDSFRMLKRYVHAEGHAVWGDLSVALVRDGDGHPLHLIAQILDVTEQREREARLEAARAELQREHQTLEAIFEAVSVGLLLIGRDGRYERMNRRHRETMDLPFPDGHAGQAGQLGHVYHLDGETLLTAEEMPSSRAVAGEEFSDFTYWVGRDPRTRAAFSTSARQVRGPDGERLGAALAYQEVTELLRAVQVQDEFVSSVSHELRTPITSVLGYLELLCDHDDLPTDVLAQLHVVRRNAERLESLLSDLLLVGQVGEDRLVPQRAWSDLAAVLDEAVESVRPAAAERGVDVALDAPTGVTALVDEQQVRQVVDNLLSNAVKYSDVGGAVGVLLRQVAGAVEIEVRDTGMGIPSHEVDLVFGRFFRGDAAREQHIAGTGLGLDIVSSIVAAHAGTVSVESEVGRGSTFRVVLPQPGGVPEDPAGA